jgi:hypothetical protein
MVEVEVEIVDAPMDYNLLLGRNWTYVMVVVVSSVFRTLCFPHQGEIVTIDQLSFAYSNPTASIGSSIPVIKNSQLATISVSECILPSWVPSTSRHRFTMFTPCLVGML